MNNRVISASAVTLALVASTAGCIPNTGPADSNPITMTVEISDYDAHEHVPWDTAPCDGARTDADIAIGSSVVITDSVTKAQYTSKVLPEGMVSGQNCVFNVGFEVYTRENTTYNFRIMVGKHVYADYQETFPQDFTISF